MRVAALLALAVLAAGCGGEPAPRRVSAPAAGAGIDGTYARTVTGADVTRTAGRRRRSGGQSAPEPGPVTLVLGAGTLRFRDDRAGVTIRQDASTTDDGVLRIGAYRHPELGSFCGPDVPPTAAYRWRRDGDALVLRATDDACADRDAVLSGRWVPRPG